MYSMEELYSALRKAHAAGDKKSAARLTQFIQSQVGQAPEETVPEAPKGPETAGMGEAFMGGAKHMLGSMQTGVSGMFGAEDAAKAGQARQEAITERPGASLDKVQSVYNEKGLFPAAREAISQVPSAVSEQLPNLGVSLGGARLGGMAGAELGLLGGPFAEVTVPVGTLIGGLAGAFAPSYFQQAGSNLERQAQEGKPIQGGAAYAAAVPQAALDVFTDKLLFSKLMGLPVKQLGRAEADAVVAKSLKRTLAEGTVKGIAAEVPPEVAQQMLERYQAGLSLTDADARKEYANTAYQTMLTGPLGAVGKLQERGEAKQVVAQDEAERQQAAAQAQAQAQRQATGTMDQQPLFTEEQAPTPAGPMPQAGFTPQTQAETSIPEPTTSIPDVEVPTQGELFTPRGKPSQDALNGVEAARLQGLPAKIQELLQTPEGRAELAGNMKMYFPDLDVKERNKTRQAIQQGTYGVEPVEAPEGTLTPELLKTFGITPRSKQFKALNGGNLADPNTYNYLTTIAATPTDFGVKANRILEAFPQYNPNAAQPDLFGVPNAPQTKPQAEPSQPDLFGVQPNGVPDTTEQQGTEQGMGVPVQPAETTPEEVTEPIGPGVVGDNGVPQSNTGAAGPSTAGQPSALAPVPKKVARDAAAALKKEPVATTWGFLSDIPFAKLSKVAKDKVKDAHAQGYLNQELADEIERIEAGNARATAAGKAITPETPLDETLTQAPAAPVAEPLQGLAAEAAAMPDIARPLLSDENKQIEDLNGKNLLQVAKWFSTNAPSKSYRVIANILANRFADFQRAGVTYEFEFTDRLKGGNRGQCHTSMDHNTGEIKVKVSIQNSSGGKKYEVVLHELIHAAVDSAIGVVQLARKRGGALPGYAKYVDQISAVAKETKKIIRQRAANGLANDFELNALAQFNNAFANEFEFVTWGLTNPDMQATLDSIPMGTQGKTLWSEFVTVIRNLLGIPASANTALSELIAASEGLLNTPYADIKGTMTQLSSVSSNQIDPQTATPAFKKWFGDSKVVNADGTPKVGYHTTVGNFDEFNKGQRGFRTNLQNLGLSFVTFDQNWANKFGFTTDADVAELNASPSYREVALESNQNGRNIMPLFVKAENPFDFENPNHVRHLTNTLLGLDARRVAEGDWGQLENKRVIDFLKANGYDGMYVSERGAKNLAVFEPNQLKSAVGNKGTFDATDNIITNQIDPQAQAQANQFIAGMSGTLAQSAPRVTITPTQAAQNFVATVYNRPTDALGMIESMANRIRTGAIDKAAHLSASIQDHNDGAFYDVNNQIRADLKLSAANNTNNYINSVFTFGDIDILPNGAIQAKQGTHSVDNIFRHAKTLADRIGVEQMRKLVTDSFYHYRAKAIIDNVSPDKWPENWQKDPRMVPTQAQINAAMAAFNTFPELRAMQNEFIGSKNQMVKFLRKAGFLSAEKARAFLADDSYAPWLRLKEYQDTMPGLGNVGKMVDLSQMKALVGGTEEVNDMLENMAQMIGWCVRSGVSNHTANSALETMTSMGTAVRHAGRPGSGNPAHVVMTYTDGKPTFWTVENPYDLAAFQSVKGLNSPTMRAIGKALGTLRAGIVLFPAFPLRQVVMDSQRAFVEAGVKNPWSMVGKIYKSFLTGEAFRGEHQDIQTLMQHGVVGGADFTAMDTTRGRATQFGVGEEANTITDKWVRSPAYNFLHKLAYSADLAVRLGIYRQTLEETGDETLAATKAREIINFQKSGTSELMHTLKQTIPFLGAYLQGMDVNYRGMVGRGNSMQSRKAAAKAYWGNMAMYAGLTIAYTMAMSGDDDYEDQKGYVTDHNFLIPGGGLLPIPPDVGFLAKVVPERITDYILQEGTDSPESARRLRQGLLQSFAAGYMPPAAVYGVTPAIELMLNKSFFSDMPIVSQRMQGLDPKFQYTASTSEIAKEIGDITGQSPLQIDYLFNAIGGTSAGALLQLADVAFGSGKMAPDKTPIIGSFQQKTVGGRNAEEYYALREMSDRAYNTVQALATEQNPEKLQEYLSDPKKQQLYAMHQGIESLHAQLNQVSRVRNIIEKDPNLSPEEKRQKVNELLANVEATLRAMPIRKQRAELE